jgi:hypothetical protein
MITFEHQGITVKCKPENAAKYRAAMDKPPKPRTVAEKREYPNFQAGKTTTADYLRDYAGFNARLLLSGFTFTHADRLAPMLDATAPEVLEELDADWVPPPPKARKITPKQAIIQALDALKAGDVDTAQCILTEALK